MNPEVKHFTLRRSKVAPADWRWHIVLSGVDRNRLRGDEADILRQWFDYSDDATRAGQRAFPNATYDVPGSYGDFNAGGKVCVRTGGGKVACGVEVRGGKGSFSGSRSTPMPTALTQALATMRGTSPFARAEEARYIVDHLSDDDRDRIDRWIADTKHPLLYEASMQRERLTRLLVRSTLPATH